MTADELWSSLPSQGVVLVSGPPMTGKYELLTELVASAADRALVVSTKHRASRVVDDLHEAGLDPVAEVGVVDAVTTALDRGEEAEADLVRDVDGPDNLTSTGVAFSELADRLSDEAGDDRLVVGIHSLAQLVLANDLESVYQFLQVIAGQIRTAGWFGVAVVDQPLATGDDPAVLEHHFDGVIETDRADEDRQFRVKHRQGLTPWASF